MKRNSWKILVLLVLALAVVTVMNAKRISGGAPAQPSNAEVAAPTSEESGGPRLVDLGSVNCIPCKMMAPILDELRDKNVGTIEVIFYDVAERQDKAREYGIKVIPTQVFFDAEGKEFFRHEGFMPKADIIAKFKEKDIMLKGAQ